VISQKFNLINENISEDNPNDIAYVFSGYAPLSVRFCQYLTGPNWKIYGDIVGMLPGPYLEETQALPNGVRKRSNIFYLNIFIQKDFKGFFLIFLINKGNSTSSINSSQSSQNPEKKMTLVFFIGGCTFAEISAFRYLSEAPESTSEFIVATSCIINGNSLLTSINT